MKQIVGGSLFHFLSLVMLLEFFTLEEPLSLSVAVMTLVVTRCLGAMRHQE